MSGLGKNVEEWKTIASMPDYEISSKGRVRSKDRYVKCLRGQERLIRSQIIKAHTRKDGYQTVSLCDKAKHKSFKVHRLVAEAFIPNPDNKPQVNHINCERADNNADNLEWATGKENMEWASDLGQLEGRHYKKLIAINITTGEVRFYKGTLAAEEDGFDRAAIWRCMTGEYSHHHGYTFKYL